MERHHIGIVRIMRLFVARTRHEDQIFSIRVQDEVALGVECQGYRHEDIVERVNYAMKKLRIENLSCSRWRSL